MIFLKNNNLNVLVTGGAGYVGQVLLRSMPQNWNITVLDNVYVGNSGFTPEDKIKFVKDDIRNNVMVEKLISKNDAVIHLAGIVGDSCPKNPKIAKQVNVDATKHIAKLCKKFEKRLVFMSTCSVYGFNDEICTEQTKPNPLNEYSIHKVLGEKSILENVDNYLIFRMGTVYGWSPRMRFDLGINLFIEKKLWGESIDVYGGNQWRPLIHVKDAANALILAVMDSHVRRILNLVDKNYLLIELARQITDKVNIVDHNDDNRSYKVDNTTIKNSLKWKPLMNIKNAINEFEKIDYKNDIYYNRRWDYS